ncbi:Hypothetical predicted protein [Mytilus galloprovincialis]|uniref:Integrase catalytic domain-containing protein n=1 Tax=Mytilus galloprovincialis TaxID=29158 RepID=A0A8B6DVN8_MYTGA|nr:Hypothetical predicted protein [Mytilus galloprovincialis]
MQVKESGYPMERIAMDILGELPASEKGNKYILVISDYYTKWTESHPMPNMEATTVANILMTEVISRFGVPTIIHSDQGSQFESHLFKEMCKLLQIEKTRTTPYHPKSDGMVERFNKTLATMLTGMRPCPQQILRGELVDEQSPEKTGELESEIHDEEVIIDSLPY